MEGEYTGQFPLARRFYNWLVPLWLCWLLAGCTGGSGTANPDPDPFSPPSNINISAWVGPENTEIQLPSGLAGIDVYSSSDPYCDYDSFGACLNGDLATNLADGARYTDRGATTLTQSGFYQVRLGDFRGDGALGISRFSPRQQHQAVFFKQRFWLVGGYGAALSNEVWSSLDGLNWYRVAPNEESAIFTPRQGHQLVVFDSGDGQGERLWVIGGRDAYTNLDDIWSSTDGRRWDAERDHAEFPARTFHQVVSFKQQLWVIGGLVDADAGLNDVWVSADGVQWQPVEALPPRFAERGQHQVVVFDGQLWLIGGRATFHEVWRSEDGKTWTDVTEPTQAELPSRSDHQLEVFNNRLWLIGGFDGSKRLSDVWSMSKTGEDSYQWQDETSNSNFAEVAPIGIRRFQTLVAKDRLWLIGGLGRDLSNEVWSSPDGLHWEPVTNQSEFSAREQHQVVVFDDDHKDDLPARLWLIGGNAGQSGANEPSDDIWSSRDGLNWTLELAGDRFSARSGHRVAVFNDRLWLVGGKDDSGVLNDVWSSDNGLDWDLELATGDAPFVERQAHQLTTFNNKLWLIAGQGKGGPADALSDVWSLTDRGETWQNRSATQPENFPARQFHQAVVFNDELLLIAGTGRKDVWSLPSNETLWQEKTGGLRFSSRGGHQVAVYNDGEGEQLWLVGGFLDGLGDVWSSIDGNEWKLVTGQATFKAANNHQLVTYDDGSGAALWLVGGTQLGFGGPHNQVWRSRDGALWRQGIKGRFRLQ